MQFDMLYIIEISAAARFKRRNPLAYGKRLNE